jgi:hypothetical protein
METTQFQPYPGQESLVRDGVPSILSRQAKSLVLVRPARRQFESNQRPIFVLAMYNLTGTPLQFAATSVSVAQIEQGGQIRPLRVYTYDELVAEEQRRQTVRAIGAGLAMAGNSMSAASAGYYNGTATVYGPYGASTVNVRGYDPTAAAIAQSTAAAQNEAMIANTVAIGQRNMDALERSVIKDDTLLPGEWYGGQIQFDPPNGSSAKSYVITLRVGADTHQVAVLQSRPSGG